MSSDIGTPAPPPPPVAPAAPAFDFAKPFTFVFDDPQWINKVLLGGVFVFLSYLLIGIPFVLGYVAQLARNVIAGLQYPLPDWDKPGAYFNEGLRLVVIPLVYVAPLILVALAAFVPFVFGMSAADESLHGAAGCLMIAVWCVIFPVGFAVMLFVPAAMLLAIAENRLGAAFELGRVWAFIKANFGNYVLAIVVHFVAQFLAQFGFYLLCVGVLFTAFWATVVAEHAFAQVYRLSERR